MRPQSWLIPLLMSLVFCLSSCQASVPRGEPVALKTVRSAQTLEVNFRGEDVTIRLAGFDAPGRKQLPWGEAAYRLLIQKLAQPGMLTFEPSEAERDRYDRQWGYLWQDDQLINAWIVEQGYGLVEPGGLTPYKTQLSHAQDYARIMGVGVWNPQQPMRQTPQAFRAQSRP